MSQKDKNGLNSNHKNSDLNRTTKREKKRARNRMNGGPRKRHEDKNELKTNC